MKEAVIKKGFNSGSPHHEIAKEAGIGRSPLTYWIKNYKQNGNTPLVKKEKRPQAWTAEERINALMETGTLPEKDRVSWCQSNKLLIHHLVQRKKDVVSLLASQGKRVKREPGRNESLIRPEKELENRFAQRSLA